MKKIILFFAGIAALGLSSCSDMLDVDGGREVEMPELTQKTDSVFYVAGIMEAMQHASELYVIQNEMRGDLATTTIHSDRNLQDLADFSATGTNKYDSAYVYYKVVNNCNYYLAHRDTALYDGASNVTLNEYATVLAFRAWAYLQLARTYGKVKFFTEPLTSLSQIENDNSPMLGISEIVNELAPQLIKFKNTEVPYYGSTWNSDLLSRCCIPVDVILGELYLEAGEYANAAQSYYEYFYKNRIIVQNALSSFNPKESLWDNVPRDFSSSYGNAYSWLSWSSGIISTDLALGDIVTYVPMSTNKLEGYTPELPKLFGFNPYYAVANNASSMYKLSSEMYDSVFLQKIQIVPSDEYYLVADSSDYYYQTNDPINPELSVMKGMGDMRARARVTTIKRPTSTSTEEVLNTYVSFSPFITLYRNSNLWLHLAEALNRMGYPDAAFAILKDGITDNVKGYGYVREETWNLLTTTLPFCSEDGKSEQSGIFSGTGTDHNYGIHRHGCSDNYGISGDKSLYTMSGEVERKIAALEKAFAGLTFETVDRSGALESLDAEIDDVTADASLSDDERAEKLAELGARRTKLSKEYTALGNRDIRDVINAVEDLLCDEYAMESAFEGNRFADLMRLARNKNGAGNGEYTGSPTGYGQNFGGRWIANKLTSKNPKKDLTAETNWYLPFN